MRGTHYFWNEAQRKHSEVQIDWIERVIAAPVARVIQLNGRIRLWAPIAEYGGQYLRVVLQRDGITVHNAFFDRSFRPPKAEGGTP